MVEKVDKASAITHHSQQQTNTIAHGEQSEVIFTDLGGHATEIGMKINPKKTKLLCISGATSTNVTSYMRVDDTEIRSERELKVLGFWFNSRPDASLHVKKMCDKVKEMLWSMRKRRLSGMPPHDLVNIYKSIIRPVLDFAVPSYHPLLTAAQSDEIEALQMTAMKIAVGVAISYREVIENDVVEPLKERRKRICKKFALKAVNNPRFSESWFPKNREVTHDLRRRDHYLTERARTERMRRNPINYMRTILNDHVGDESRTRD